MAENQKTVEDLNTTLAAKEDELTHLKHQNDKLHRELDESSNYIEEIGD